MRSLDREAEGDEWSDVWGESILLSSLMGCRELPGGVRGRSPGRKRILAYYTAIEHFCREKCYLEEKKQHSTVLSLQ